MTKKAIVWIREDFRIEDNEALAIKEIRKILSYIFIIINILIKKEKLKNGGYLNRLIFSKIV